MFTVNCKREILFSLEIYVPEVQHGGRYWVPTARYSLLLGH